MVNNPGSTLTWLHLSDLHMRAKERDSIRGVLDALWQDLRSQIEQVGRPLDFIVFSGDVAYSGQKEEYDLAKRDFFDPLLKTARVSPDRVYLVPGNHDVDRTTFDSIDIKSLQSRLSASVDPDEAMESVQRQLIPGVMPAYAEFARQYRGSQPADPSESPPPHHYFRQINLTGTTAGPLIAVLGLNSAWFSALVGPPAPPVSDRGRIRMISERQLTSLLQLASGASLVLAVLHHPLDWIAEEDHSWINSLLSRRCDVVLHGHWHRPRSQPTQKPDSQTVYIPAGAVYGNPDLLKAYNIVQFDRATRAVEYSRRRYDKQMLEWVPDVSPGDQPHPVVFSLAPRVQSPPSQQELPKVVRSALGDQPTKKATDDHLDFSAYARAIAAFIRNPKTDKPLVIAVDAPWGMGKTSLLHLVKEELQQSRTEYQSTAARRAEPGLGKGPEMIAPTSPRVDTKQMEQDSGKQGLNERLRRARSQVLGLWHNVGWKRRSLQTRLSESSRQLRRRWHERVRWETPPTVWFNAWKHDTGESLFAALARAVLLDVREQSSWLQRAQLWGRLTLRRLDLRTLAWSLFKTMVYLAVLIALIYLAVWKIPSCLNVTLLNNETKKGLTDKWTNDPLAVIGAFMGGAGIVTLAYSIVRDFVTHLVEPFQRKPFDLRTRRRRFSREPDYAARMSFQSRFERDFQCIVQTLTRQDQPLVIFIDDLDRCAPPKPADIMEAINILCSIEDCQCMFVIAMDSQAVAASIQAKYKELTTCLNVAEDSEGLALGRLFLEKIIQISFTIPKADDDAVRRFIDRSLDRLKPDTTAAREDASGIGQSIDPRASAVQERSDDGVSDQTPGLGAGEKMTESDMTQTDEEVVERLTVRIQHFIEAQLAAGTPVQEAIQQAGQAFRDIWPEIIEEATRRAAANWFEERADVRKVIGELALDHLDSNPRQIKRFINTFRLQMLIAIWRGLFEKGEISLRLLAASVIMSMRYPDALEAMMNDEGLAERLLSVSHLRDQRRKYEANRLEVPDGLTSELSALLAYHWVGKLADATDLMRLLRFVEEQVDDLSRHLRLARGTA